MNKILVIAILVMASTLTADSNLDIATSKYSEFFTADKIDLYGDIRLRHQEVHRDDKDNSYKRRYRIRAGLHYEVTHQSIFTVQMASGKGNPTSGNVDLDDGISTEKFKVDILDFVYKLDDKSWLRAGKSKHYFYRPMHTQLIWDNDIRPEGISYGKKDGDRFTAGIAKVHRLEREAQSDGDIYMFTSQYVHKIDNLNIGGGFYHYRGVKGNTPTYKKGALGNSLDAGGRYAHDYSILEGMVEYQIADVFNRPFKAATILAYNAATSDENFAYDFSMQWGKAKKVNEWRLGYTYRNIQKDAVYAAHNDSDFINGGSDGHGHIFSGRMNLHKHMNIAFNYQWTTRKVFEKKDLHYDRLMLDMSLKF